MEASSSEYSTVDSRKSHRGGSGPNDSMSFGGGGSIGVPREQIISSLNSHFRKELNAIVEENEKYAFASIPIMVFDGIVSSFRLLEELVSVQKAYQGLLVTALKDKKMKLQRLGEMVHGSSGASGSGGGPGTSGGTPSTSTR